VLAVDTHPPTPVGRFARTVFVVGVCLTFGTGIGLFAVPGRTAGYWAWTIKAPLSAAFFGGGYLGAAVALALAASEREWRRTRTVAVMALTLTSLALLATLRALSQFAFHAGGVREAVTWTWLAVYVALPPLVFAAFVVQERAGGAHEYDVQWPPLRATRAVMGVAGVVVGAIGVGLLADWGSLTARWPWPLPALPAGIVGAWLLTLASGLLWFAVRERDWSRARFGVGPMVVPLGLALVSAVRLHGGFGGRTATAVYLAGISLLLVVIGAAALAEEHRLRAASAAPAVPAAMLEAGRTSLG